MTTREPEMAAIVPLLCEMTDPVDGLCRVAGLLRRCGIDLLGLDLRPADRGAGRFLATFRLAGPLPFPAAQLEARLAAMPAIARAVVAEAPTGTDPAADQTPMSGSRSRVQPAIRHDPSSSCRMV